MKTKLISILGAGNYVKCNYDEFKNCKYIQEALIRKYKDSIEEVLIFGTNFSRERNWEKADDSDSKLKETLDALKKEGINFNYKFIKIPNGYSEEEIWDIYNIFLGNINNNDKLYFDITHGFRFQPMLIMNIINYIKVVKKVELLKIEYGLFEKLGPARKVAAMPIEERNAEIMDLSSFDYLNNWVKATDNFLLTGNISKISNLSKLEVSSVLKETKGQDLFFRNLSTLIRHLKRFDRNLKTCRGKEILTSLEVILDILNEFEQSKKIKNPRILPFLSMISKIQEKFKEFSLDPKDEVKNYLGIIKWCIDHDLIQQGFTVLDETITTFICIKLNILYTNVKNRQAVESALKYSNKIRNSSIDSWRKIDEGIFSRSLKLLEGYEKLSVYYDDIRTKFRNDINHFGMRGGSSSVEKLEVKLNEYYEYIKEIVLK